MQNSTNYNDATIHASHKHILGSQSIARKSSNLVTHGKLKINHNVRIAYLDFIRVKDAFRTLRLSNNETTNDSTLQTRRNSALVSSKNGFIHPLAHP